MDQKELSERVQTLLILSTRNIRDTVTEDNNICVDCVDEALKDQLLEGGVSALALVQAPDLTEADLERLMARVRSVIASEAKQIRKGVGEN